MRECLKNKIHQKGLSQAGVARLIGLPQQVVSRWANGHQIPASRVLQLCEIMEWTITPHELRPDIYPNPTDGLPVGCKANTQNTQELIHENQA
ncbi:transcriptional regulator [Escherichia coli]|uniref:transcriptional regulator n=1 Tax=Escherichia coli TaxID=562 RepID=UPI001C1AD515|nr:YdaS family helix-turn-helix protein [Escherichia coli]HBE5554406.1 helix-turn-helix domain-containing protein [Escherichia coli]HCW2859906.1 helix-turn-helix domain-containing protein [Escherichia coli]HCW2884963.1 helix-turn-helix domain-containing protein [Escherichia coli]HDL0238108.1 helix-turn-helix domain-containing protein [Escherichia coli]